MEKTKGAVTKALTHPTVAHAHNAFMMYHFKDYNGAAKEAKEAGKDLYKRLKNALRKESYVDSKHPYHLYSDERLHDIVKKSGAAAKTSHDRGEGGVIGRYFDKEVETASAILKKRKQDRGWRG